MLLERKKNLLHPLILAVSVFALYAHTLQFPILRGWDDNLYISANTEHLEFNSENLLHWLHTPSTGAYLPLTMYSYMLDYNLWGLDGTGYHLQNILWHIAAALGFFACLRKLGTQSLPAFLFALIFAIHPQRAESVAWLSERKDVICAAFYFWSIRAYIGKNPGRTRRAYSFILFALAMFSKSMAISLPFILLFYEIARNRNFIILEFIKKLWAFFLLAAVFVPVTYSAQVIPGTSTPLKQAYAVIRNIPWYVFKTAYPVNLCPVYPRVYLDSMTVLMAILFYILALITAYLAWRKGRDFFLFSFAPVLLCFLFSLGPVVGVFATASVDYADRYSYIPSAFLLSGLALYMRKEKIFRKIAGFSPVVKNSLAALSGSYIIFLGIQNFYYSKCWSSYPSILRAACYHKPPAYLALDAYANYSLARGDYIGTIQMAEKIENRRKGLISEEAEKKLMLKAKCLKAVALFHLDRKREALPIFTHVQQHIDESFFPDHKNYSLFMKMIEESRSAVHGGNR